MGWYLKHTILVLPMSHLYNDNKNKQFRQNLRNNLTVAEATLWNYLKNKQLKGRKFRRQYSVGNYVLDFYCPDERIAIELDGSVHSGIIASNYDDDRTAYLNNLNIKVIRFENIEVLQDIDRVILAIENEFV